MGHIHYMLPGIKWVWVIKFCMGRERAWIWGNNCCMWVQESTCRSAQTLPKVKRFILELDGSNKTEQQTRGCRSRTIWTFCCFMTSRFSVADKHSTHSSILVSHSNNMDLLVCISLCQTTSSTYRITSCIYLSLQTHFAPIVDQCHVFVYVFSINFFRQ